LTAYDHVNKIQLQI